MPKVESNLNVSREATSLRFLVENRLRSAIGNGVFKPGQRLIERELCEQTGVGRTRVTLLRMTSMTQKNRIGKSIPEIERILTAIEAGDEMAAEAACVQHIQNAAAVALKALQQSHS